MKKYGLQLRVQPSQQKKQPTKPPLPPPLGFSQDDDDDDDVEREISRHASKNKSLREIEEQQKKALEEDPSVFDYDGVYDEMKEKSFRHKVQDRQDTKPKYIQKLIQKAEERKREHDIIYERKLTKERSKEDHLYEDKDKFVTSAYRKKLEEQKKWEAEQRLRDLRDEKDAVTKKSDLSDFYFNLGKNVAFGAEDAKSRKVNRQAEVRNLEPEKDHSPTHSNSKQQDIRAAEPSRIKEGHQAETSAPPKSLESLASKPVSDVPISVQDDSSNEQPSSDEPKRDHHKRSEDTLAAAKERFLARKRMKEQ
ncbi:nuclear speckle splicing regulatory protein 1-like [Pistacia vera]|uniref:nuclear speckle splicing regulatory protein 1-like n=1 Tax=Pistacia vera TaxID=55513 RepID=UPI001263C95A|nr:nuclear speckle splicing regulatory protein 1-like [Pistacia vera]XP_031280461.1 nuclear speckle splicing regulatory protein 1-like [Pistacia vera]